MVVVDASGHPMKYDQLQIRENAVGTQNVRMELDVPREDGRGWRRTHSFTETQDDHTTTPNCSLTSIHMEQAVSTRSWALVAFSTTLEIA